METLTIHNITLLFLAGPNPRIKCNADGIEFDQLAEALPMAIGRHILDHINEDPEGPSLVIAAE